MDEPQASFDDTTFLASRSLDEDLSAHEREQLRKALSASAAARAEARDLRGVDCLVRWWGLQTPQELDWENFAAVILGRISAPDDEEGDRRLDELLSAWRRIPVSIDEPAYTARVLAEIRAESQRERPQRLLLRLAGPLAAAAAVGLIVSGVLLDWISKGPRIEVAIHRPVELPYGGQVPQRLAVVSYRREAQGLTPDETVTPGIRFMYLGASPEADEMVEEPPPL